MSSRPRIGITTRAGGAALPTYQAYAAAVEAAGGEPVWLDPETLAGTDPQEVLRDLDGLLLSGGVDLDPQAFGEGLLPDAGVEVDPQRDTLELPLARAALADDLPVFGICRGAQTIAVAAGGSLYQDLGLAGYDRRTHQQREAGKDETALAHAVEVKPGTKLAAAVGEGRRHVNSFHHQAVREVPEGFVVAAQSDDGIVEALEDPRRPFVLGVLWHPERLVDRVASQRALFEMFVEAARARVRSPR